jgi:hypothetical protein
MLIRKRKAIMKKMVFAIGGFIALTLLGVSAEKSLSSTCKLLTVKEVSGWLGTGLTVQSSDRKAPITKPGTNQVTGTVPSSECSYTSATDGLNLEIVAFASAQIAQEQTKVRQDVMKLSMPDLKIIALSSPGVGAFSVNITTPSPTTILGFTKKNIAATITVFQKNKNPLEATKMAAKLVFLRLP